MVQSVKLTFFKTLLALVVTHFIVMCAVAGILIWLELRHGYIFQ